MTQPGRNSPCPCGSGKKFKHCCAGNGASPEFQSPRTPEQRRKAAQTLVEQGLAFHQSNQVEHAEEFYRQALVFDKRNPDAWNLLGVVLCRPGRNQEGLDCIGKALKINPKIAGYHNSYGLALMAIGESEKASAHFREAIRLDPSFAEAYNNLGILLRAGGQPEAAVERYRKAIAIKPGYGEAHNNLGNALRELGILSEAERNLRRALALKPDYAEALANLGAVMADLGNSEEAERNYLDSVALDPAHVNAYMNLGNALLDQGRTEDALEYLNKALALNPASNETRFNKSLALFCSGKLAEAWELYEYRVVTTGKRDFPQAPWQGQNLAGKSVLIWGEQGLGDELLFSSLYSEVIARARRCVIECKPKLASLFSNSFQEARVVPHGDPPSPFTLSDIDYQVSAGSLGRMLRPTLESFPGVVGHLRPDSSRISHWQEQLGKLGSGLKVGICWRSSNTKGPRALACTTLGQWGPIFSVPGINFVNLQYDECALELAEARERFGVEVRAYPEVDLFDDLYEAAALTKAMDLVISAPTSASVLAAAVGVPTWQMAYGADWQTLGTDYNPWFPSIRQYRRRWNQDWETIIENIARDLRRETRTA